MSDFPELILNRNVFHVNQEALSAYLKVKFPRLVSLIDSALTYGSARFI